MAHFKTKIYLLRPAHNCIYLIHLLFIRMAEFMKQSKENSYQEIIYVHDTLLKLRHIAQTNQYPMLAYFIEMAWVEASDVLRTQFGPSTRN